MPHWPLHRRIGSKDSTASPTSPTSVNPSSASKTIPPSTSSSSSSGIPGTSTQRSTATQRSTVAMQTRAHLRSIVRNDWKFPDPPVVPEDRLPPETSYVRRNISLSSPEASPILGPQQPISPGVLLNSSNSQRERGTGLFHRRNSSTPKPSGTTSPAISSTNDPYRYANPEAISSSIQKRLLKRKRAFYEEALINPGLRHFLDRRNAWTSACLLTRPISPSSTFTRSSLTDTELVKWEEQPLPIPSTAPVAPNAVPPTSLIPLPPPLLERDHPIRQGINESSYPEIYNKVVVQGVTPSIPINLKDVTRALVEGWKRDDAWPPKPGVLDPLVPVVKRGGDGFKGRTRGREAERVRVVQSERKGVESGRKSAETTLKDKKGGERGGVRKEEDTKQTGKVVGVVGKVKKVFGLGGSATTNSIFEETNSRPGNEAAVRELLAGEVEDEEAGEEEKMEAGAENKGIRNG